jgi:predicted GIY-YIG superfamily endonuclease
LSKYAYILKSEVDETQYYVGVTSNLKQRLQKHNEGGSPYTSQFRPWRLLVSIQFQDESRASEFERYLKSPSVRAFAAKHFR